MEKIFTKCRECEGLIANKVIEERYTVSADKFYRQFDYICEKCGDGNTIRIGPVRTTRERKLENINRDYQKCLKSG